MGFLLGDFKTAWTAVLTSMILSDCQLHFGCRSLEDKKEGGEFRQHKPQLVQCVKHVAWCSRIQHKYTTLPHEWAELKKKVKYNNINERC